MYWTACSSIISCETVPTATRTIGSDTDNVLSVSCAVYRCAVVATVRALRTKSSACYDRTIALP